MQFMIGKTIGNYWIETTLGSGGMGHVFQATHQHLNRRVAIKVLHPQYAPEPSFQARFRQEAQAAAELEHPHIVQVLDFGEADGLFYLVMELLPDGSVRGLLQRDANKQGLAIGLAINLIRQAADGLAYAHAHGMIHRDIKPDNLLLKRQDGTIPYQVKISDFGLARLASGGVSTAIGTTMGTPAYMSPEQCQGLAVDARSDIYALGVVLYELATGYLPFTTQTMSEAVFKHVYVEPPAPRSVRADLPPGLEAIILRCLAKRPEDRFGSAEELSRALAALEPSPESSVATITAGQQTQMSPPKGLHIVPIESTLEVATGRSSQLHATLANFSDVPHRVAVSVDGLPAGWLVQAGEPITLAPGSQATASIAVQAPSVDVGSAHEWPVLLRAWSLADPNVVAATPLNIVLRREIPVTPPEAVTNPVLPPRRPGIVQRIARAAGPRKVPIVASAALLLVAGIAAVIYLAGGNGGNGTPTSTSESGGTIPTPGGNTPIGVGVATAAESTATEVVPEAQPTATTAPEATATARPTFTPTPTPVPTPFAVTKWDQAAGGRNIALTFSIGKTETGTGYATTILDILAARRVTATFAINGVWAAANPNVLRRIRDDGHQIINATYNGDDLTEGSSQQRKDELQLAGDTISSILGGYDTRPFFRPPLGAGVNDAAVIADAASVGYYVMVVWSVDGQEYLAERSGEQVFDDLTKFTTPGDVVVFSVTTNGGGGAKITSILDDLLSYWNGLGYRYVTIRDLVGVPE